MKTNEQAQSQNPVYDICAETEYPCTCCPKGKKSRKPGDCFCYLWDEWFRLAWPIITANLKGGKADMKDRDYSCGGQKIVDLPYQKYGKDLFQRNKRG